MASSELCALEGCFLPSSVTLAILQGMAAILDWLSYVPKEPCLCLPEYSAPEKDDVTFSAGSYMGSLI